MSGYGLKYSGSDLEWDSVSDLKGEILNPDPN